MRFFFLLAGGGGYQGTSISNCSDPGGGRGDYSIITQGPQGNTNGTDSDHDIRNREEKKRGTHFVGGGGGPFNWILFYLGGIKRVPLFWEIPTWEPWTSFGGLRLRGREDLPKLFFSFFMLTIQHECIISILMTIMMMITITIITMRGGGIYTPRKESGLQRLAEGLELCQGRIDVQGRLSQVAVD